MKHIIFYVLTALCACGLTYVIIHNHEEKVPKLLTIDTTYTYLYDDQQIVEIIFYVNQPKHPLTHQQSYDLIYLSNEQETKKIEVELISIAKRHVETYLGETYQQIMLQLKCPYVDGYYEIKDAYLNINLVNQHHYQFRIGDLFIHQKQDNTTSFNWTSLYGMKAENQFMSRLSHIHIPYDYLDKTISSISIGSDDNVSFELENHVLKLVIVHQNRLLYQAPIIITFADGSVSFIDNFRYMIDYQLLKESGPLVNIYVLD